ncbi:hypothetical protein ACT8ZV_12610 [Nocardioides sp. MAHUQ-72]|uniref:hypothetical protein n=1 Tax=unclassified Nocardioides TaxID=2615069 RepID=UPI0036084EEA
MIAFLLSGLVLGVLARGLHGGSDDPDLALTVAVGLVGAVLGGSGINLVLGRSAGDLDAWSLASACVVSFVGLGLFEARVGRAR